MRVSLFGLFLRCTSLMEPWPKLIRSVLLVIGFIRIFGFMIIIILAAHTPFIPCILFHLSPVLILSYLEYFLFDIYLLTCSCSRHGFLCMLMSWIYRYTCTYLSTPSGICITTRLGSFIWLPWILMSRSWSLERVDSPSCWSEWRSGSVDLQQAVQSSILPGPLVRL